MKRLIIYGVGIAGTVYLAILYESILLVTLALAELFVPVSVAFLAKQTARRLQVRLSLPVSVVDAGKESVFEVRLLNSSIFPAARVELWLMYWNQFHNQKTRKKLVLCGDGKSENSYQYQISSEHCGKLVIYVERIRVRDYLGLTSFSVCAGQRKELLVFPKIFAFQAEAGECVPCVWSESGEVDPNRGGDDPSEIFQIRAYRPGDRVQKIHWKMTARTDEWMVREFSRPVDCKTAVFLDLQGELKQPACWENADDYMAIVFSLERGLLKSENRNYVVWYEAGSGQLCRKKLEKWEDVYELAEQLFQVMPYKEAVDLESLYRSEYPEETFSVLYRLDLQCRLWKGGTLYWEKAKMPPSV